MLDIKAIITPALLTNPQFKTENGVHYKLDHFEQTERGFVPVYTETDEVSEAEALDFLFGGDK